MSLPAQDIEGNIKGENKSNGSFSCEKCKYTTDKKGNYSRHLLSGRHKKMHNESDCLFFELGIHKYQCIMCKFVTTKQTNYSSHLLSKKHLNNIELGLEEGFGDSTNNDLGSEDDDGQPEGSQTNIKSLTNDTHSSAMVTELIRQNAEFQQMLIDRTSENVTLAKQLIEVVKDNKAAPVIYNNTINNKFNLNFFLNDTCKEALNVDDFVKYLSISTSDVSNFGERGYVKGICDIVIRGLNELGQYKRPIHCSDVKRNIIYIKDNDVWEKDTGEKMKTHLIRRVNTKSIHAISDWEVENPSSKHMASGKNDQYLKIVRNSMSGRTDAEIDLNFKRIVNTLSEKTSIAKQLQN